MILTGDPITAAEALAAGLINRVVPAESVLDEARALAARVAVNAPLAVQASRKVLTRAFVENDATLFNASIEAFMSMMGTEDFHEGPRAFIEKRPPRWTGR
ncbi:MAG: enoyl-CoA hydratase, partial [Actinobacteria bacterium]|nr:enoyl-CoA hydratase [Actinomycetota bacterium]